MFLRFLMFLMFRPVPKFRWFRLVLMFLMFRPVPKFRWFLMFLRCQKFLMCQKFLRFLMFRWFRLVLMFLMFRPVQKFLMYQKFQKFQRGLSRSFQESATHSRPISRTRLKIECISGLLTATKESLSASYLKYFMLTPVLILAVLLVALTHIHHSSGVWSMWYPREKALSPMFNLS